MAAIPDIEEMVDADHIVRGEGVRWFREYLGEDPEAPIDIPSSSSFSFLRSVIVLWASGRPSEGFPEDARRAAMRAYGLHDMVNHMKTTVEIPDPLLAQAKRAADADGVTLRALIEEGLRRVLKDRRSGRFELRRASFGGSGVQADVQEGNWERVRDLIYTGRGA